jgi:hypothetical protein
MSQQPSQTQGIALRPEDVITEPENRVAFVWSQHLMKIVWKSQYRTGVMSMFEADEDTSPLYMVYKMHIALEEAFIPKILGHIESGITQRRSVFSKEARKSNLRGESSAIKIRDLFLFLKWIFFLELKNRLLPTIAG